MANSQSILVLAALATLGSLSGVKSAGHFVYPDLEKDEAFPDWGPQCTKGKLQSPIDLEPTKAFKGIFKSYVFQKYDIPLNNPRIENNGHTFSVKFDEPKPTLSGGGLKGEYILQEAHFHWSSEHTIDDRRYPLEVHLVHINSRYNITEAGKYSNGIAVVGILFHIDTTPNEELDKILKSYSGITSTNQIGHSLNIKEKLLLKNWLPNDVNSHYFFYKGSLTTPPCSEAVSWTVYQETQPIGMDQLEELKKLQTENGENINNNYRFTQKKGTRPVIFVMSSHHKLRTSGAQSVIYSSITWHLTSIATLATVLIKGLY